MSGRDQVLPLADFGTAKFANAYATAGGRVGSISDRDWTDYQVQLSSSATLTLPGGSAGSITLPGITITLPSSGDATPRSLSNDGSSFTDYYSSHGTTQSPFSQGFPTRCPSLGFGLGSWL